MGRGDAEPSFTQRDALIGYKILENEVPFPVEAISSSTAVTWKVCEGLARGLSVDPARVYVHYLAMGSLFLSSLKTHYSGVLGIFPNLMLNDHGASGDGKSIALWFDTQVMHFLRKEILKIKKKEWKLATAAYEAWVAAGRKEEGKKEDPGPEPTWDKLYDSGSFVGLGVQMQANEGSALLVKHESKAWIAKLLEGGHSGSMDDLNAIGEHCYWKNGPANKESRFCVDNPHLVVILLSHMEELVPLLEKAKNMSKDSKDSTNGSQRFSYVHFKGASLKLLPEGCNKEEIASFIADNDDFFNDLTFDEAVLAAVNPLLIMERLCKQDQMRTDETVDKKMFSNLSGLRSPAWSPEAKEAFRKTFNEAAVRTTNALQKVSAHVNAAKTSKDKTKPLQHVVTTELVEKCMRYVLRKSGVVDLESCSP
jgi:hypothetical protein